MVSLLKYEQINNLKWFINEITLDDDYYIKI